MINLPQSVQDKLKEWQKPGRPGFALAVIRHGKEIANIFGGETNLEYGLPITLGSSFRLASLSKMFVGAAVALMVEEGSLNVDESIEQWFPELAVSREIRVSNLLWHTSGLQDYPHLLWGVGGVPYGDSVNCDELYQMLCCLTELEFAPGSRYQYCNTNYFLLARLVATVSGTSLSTFCQDHLFAPLGMKQTRFLDDWTIPLANRAVGYTQGAEGFRIFDMPTLTLVGDDGAASSLSDLIIWYRNLVNPRLGGEVFHRLLTQQGHLTEGTPVGYGAGHFVQEAHQRKLIWHYGEFLGHQSVFRCFPEEETAIIMLANCDSLSPVGIANEIEGAFFGKSSRPSFNPWTSPAQGDISPGWYRNHRLGLVVQIQKGEFGQEAILNHRARFTLESFGNGLRAVDNHGLGFIYTNAGISLVDGDELIPLESFTFEPKQDNTLYLGEYLSPELGIRIRVLDKEGALHLEYCDRRRVSPGKLDYLYTGMYRASFQLWLRRVNFVPLSEGMALDILNWNQRPCRFVRD